MNNKITVYEFIRSCTIRRDDVYIVVLRKPEEKERQTATGYYFAVPPMRTDLIQKGCWLDRGEDYFNTKEMTVERWDMSFKNGAIFIELYTDVDFKCRFWQ